MDIVLILVRLTILLTFLITAVCVPIIFYQMRKMTKMYIDNHSALIIRVASIEKKLDSQVEAIETRLDIVEKKLDTCSKVPPS